MNKKCVVQVKQQKASFDTKQSIQDVVDQLTGISDGNIVLIIKILQQFQNNIHELANNMMLIQSEFKDHIEQDVNDTFKLFVNLCVQTLKSELLQLLQRQDILLITDQVQLVLYLKSQNFDYAYYNTLFREFKESLLVKFILESNLVCHSILNKINNYNKKDRKFSIYSNIIIKHDSFIPFYFAQSFDVKQFLFIMDKDQRVKFDEYFIKIITLFNEFYKIYISPTIDMNVIEPLLEQQFEMIEKQIPQCKGALGKIKKSFGLFKGNFDKYYKNMMKSNGSQFSLITEFVTDVFESVKTEEQNDPQNGINMKKKKSRASIISQFLQLIKYINTIVKQNNDLKNNSMIANILNRAEQKFNDLNTDYQQSDSDSQDSGDDDIEESKDGYAEDNGHNDEESENDHNDHKEDINSADIMNLIQQFQNNIL